MPELEKRLAQAIAAENQDTQLVRNKVTEEEIAEVVSKWTGIPVSKMLEGGKGKAAAHGRRARPAGWSARTTPCASSRTPSGVRARDFRIPAVPTARSCS